MPTLLEWLVGVQGEDPCSHGLEVPHPKPRPFRCRSVDRNIDENLNRISYKLVNVHHVYEDEFGGAVFLLHRNVQFISSPV